MPTLTIIYCGMTFFDGEVDGFRWEDLPGQSVTVTGQIAKAKAAATGGLGAIADLISAASRKKTEAMIADKTPADVNEGSSDD